MNSSQAPEESDVVLLRAYCRDQETPINDLAFRVARELYERLKNERYSLVARGAQTNK